MVCEPCAGFLADSCACINLDIRMRMHLYTCRCIHQREQEMTNPTKLTLVSHKLCPYVQRAVIALTEKGVPFTRRDVDLANKPDWFLRVSPLGKTPVLLVNDSAIFESAV